MHKVLRPVDAHIITDELFAFQLRTVAAEHLRIIGHHRTVIVVIPQTLVQVIGQAGVEDRIQMHLAQRMDMAVAEFCRETGGITGDRGDLPDTKPRLDTGLVCTAKPSFVQNACQNGSSS